MEIQYKPTGGVRPKFWMRTVEDKPATLKAGTPKFKEVEWVDIYIVGDKLNRPSRAVIEQDKQRFSAEYEAFRKGVDAPLQGTPLEEWAAIPRSRAEELKAMHIRTVEELADLPDNAIERIGMGARDLVAKAQDFISQDNQLEDLKKQNAEMMQRMADLEAELSTRPKKRGPKPKNKDVV